MKLYRVKVITAGQIVIHRNKQSRTPVTFENVTEAEVKFLEVQARRLRLGIDIKSEDELKNSETNVSGKVYEDVKFLNDDVKIEEMNDDNEPRTILEKLIKNAE